jgi:hypothetical protein
MRTVDAVQEVMFIYWNYYAEATNILSLAHIGWGGLANPNAINAINSTFFDEEN